MDDNEYDESYQEYLKLREKLKRPKNNVEHSISTSENHDIEPEPILYNPHDDDEIYQYILDKKGEYIREYERMIHQEDVKEKDKIICFHRESLNLIRGSFLHFEDRENVGTVLNYKGLLGGREALLLKDYILFFKPYIFKSKFRKQLESLLQLSSIRVKKNKQFNKEMIIQPDDLLEKIDEVESNDLFENIDDDS